jgi:hypothetical protein
MSPRRIGRLTQTFRIAVVDGNQCAALQPLWDKEPSRHGEADRRRTEKWAKMIAAVNIKAQAPERPNRVHDPGSTMTAPGPKCENLAMSICRPIYPE